MRKTTLSENYKFLREMGLKIMRNSRDPVHDIEHVEALQSNCADFLTETRTKIDSLVMDLAIIFHDTWKAKHRPPKNPFKQVYSELYEGLGSMLIFSNAAAKVNLDAGTTKRVMYAIRKHSTGNIFPRRTTEAKLLWDLDYLEMWNPEKFILGFTTSFGKNPKLLRLGRLFMKVYANTTIYYDWTRKKVEAVKPEFFRQIENYKVSS